MKSCAGLITIYAADCCMKWRLCRTDYIFIIQVGFMDIEGADFPFWSFYSYRCSVDFHFSFFLSHCKWESIVNGSNFRCGFQKIFTFHSLWVPKLTFDHLSQCVCASSVITSSLSLDKIVMKRPDIIFKKLVRINILYLSCWQIYTNNIHCIICFIISRPLT